MWQLLAPIWFADVVVLGHKCSDHGCNAIAPWLCYWPGQTSPKCDAHRLGWERIADVMGFQLVSSPLSVREWPEPHPSSERFAAMEMT